MTIFLQYGYFTDFTFLLQIIYPTYKISLISLLQDVNCNFHYTTLKMTSVGLHVYMCCFGISCMLQWTGEVYVGDSFLESIDRENFIINKLFDLTDETAVQLVFHSLSVNYYFPESRT